MTTVRSHPSLTAAEPAPTRARALACLNQWGGLAAVLLVALALWLPRLSGPLDLRFDAGVYYVLGTSIAQGEGYRILSEPGAPEGIQYPPLLPFLVAVHQWVLGSADPNVVAPWLRGTFALLFLLYAAAIHLLMRRWLPPLFAVAASVMCVLSLFTFFLSDLLFTEIPFALVSVLFVLLAAQPQARRRSGWRETVLFLLASAAFFLRSAGLALFAAWTLDALMQRRWRLAALRLGLAFVPFALWQGHIQRVQRSTEFAQPAYAYQRAPYQFYNVSYGTNLALADPFQPELGRAGLLDLVRRVSTNAVQMPQALAESISLQQGYWRRPIGRFQARLFGTRFLLDPLAWIPVLILMVCVCAGILLLFFRRAWLMGGLIVTSIGLVCLTPWPGQFLRYLTPLTPFLCLAALLALHVFHQAIRHRFPRARVPVGTGIAALLVLTIMAQTWYARRLFQVRQEEGASYVSREQPVGPRLFFHDDNWRAWEQAVEWIGGNTPPDAIIATSSPHLLYLRTGRLSVMPPMEADPQRARELLEAVPVSHVIVDGMEFIDISRRYALPAMQAAPERWRAVHAIGDLVIFAREDSEVPRAETWP